MMTPKWIDISLQDIVYFVIFLSLATVTGQALQQSCQGRNIFPSISEPENNTVKSITDSDYQSCDTLNQLIELMEEVNILTARTKSCYALKTVSRNVGEIDSVANKRKISVTFYFEENIEDLSAVQGILNDKVKDISNDKTATKTSCQSSSSVKTVPIGRHFMSMQLQNGSGEDENPDNSTITAVADPKEGSGGLSHTQVVVIATCAAVIGTFFIVAAALRIRNYVKRKRQEQSSRQSNCRNPGSGFQGSAGHIVAQVRRDSESSKVSRQSSSTFKGGNLYFQVNNGMSSPKGSPPKQNNLDSRPLLVVTAPSTANTPTDSNTSIHFIDEEQDRREGSQSDESKIPESSESQPLITQQNHSKTPDSDIKTEAEDSNTDLPIKESPPVAETCQQVETDQLQGRSHIDGDSSLTENKVPSSLPLDTQTRETPDIFSVSIGLTQSDDSINTHNASYHYGNQVEYSWDSGYGNYAYCPTEIDTEIFSDDDSPSPLELRVTEMTNLENSMEDDGLENSLNENQPINCHEQSSFDMLGESFDIPFDSPNGTDETTKLLALQDMSFKGDDSCREIESSIHKGCENVIDDVTFNQEGKKNQLISQDSFV